jgi:hypothetical protein
VNTLIEEYRETIREIYGDEVANNLNIQVVDGWYNITFDVIPSGEAEGWINQPTRYRKTQLQRTIANLKARARPVVGDR